MCAKPEERVDVYPYYPDKYCQFLQKLEYPESNFRYWANDPEICPFVLFTNSQNKIYYLTKKLNEQLMVSILQIGKECKKFQQFYPRKINFPNVSRRFKSDPSDQLKKNADVRLGFRLRNTYLVKAFFTFGLRRVERKAAHVIQTLNVPLLIYLYPKRIGKLCRDDERSFPFEDLHVYDLSILKPHGVYRIPPGTKYLLLSTQKNFFSFDIVDDSMVIPFRYSDPVRRRITRLPGMYDRPPKTPYIEQVMKSDNEEEMLPQQQEQPDNSFYEFFQNEPFRQALDSSLQQPIISNPLAAETTTIIDNNINNNINNNNNNNNNVINNENNNNINNENAATTTVTNDNNPQQQQNITYWLIPNPTPPVLEKSVVEVSVNFANAYQMLKNKKMEQDPCVKLDWANNNCSDPIQPLDLRVFPDENAMDSSATTATTVANCCAVENNTTNCYAESPTTTQLLENMDQTASNYDNNTLRLDDHRPAERLEDDKECFRDLDYLDSLLSAPPTNEDEEAANIIAEIMTPFMDN